MSRTVLVVALALALLFAGAFVLIYRATDYQPPPPAHAPEVQAAPVPDPTPAARPTPSTPVLPPDAAPAKPLPRATRPASVVPPSQVAAPATPASPEPFHLERSPPQAIAAALDELRPSLVQCGQARSEPGPRPGTRHLRLLITTQPADGAATVTGVQEQFPGGVSPAVLSCVRQVLQGRFLAAPESVLTGPMRIPMEIRY
jgi:hypothetical protein